MNTGQRAAVSTQAQEISKQLSQVSQALGNLADRIALGLKN
jgi:hypothetical protein